MVNIEKYLKEQGFKKISNNKDLTCWKNDSDAISIEVRWLKNIGLLVVYEENNVGNVEPEKVDYAYDIGIEKELEEFKKCIETLQKSAANFT